MAIPLGRPLPDASRDQPERRAGTPVAAAEFPRRRARPYSVLLPVGFTLPRPLPAARCALTAPFHPCPRAVAGGAGGLLSVALSLGSPPPGVTRHRVSVEPGLSSPGRSSRERPSDRLTHSIMWSCRPVAGNRREAAAYRSLDRVGDRSRRTPNKSSYAPCSASSQRGSPSVSERSAPAALHRRRKKPLDPDAASI